MPKDNRTMFSFSSSPPLALYIHLPWCVKKCPYCDFNSHATLDGSFPEKTYINALIRDLEFVLPLLQQRQISSIFMGGGTPSLFSGLGMKTLLSEIQLRFEFEKEIEITLEANPGSVDIEHFNTYRECGFNRISIGIQSFNNTMLANLGRVHDGLEAINAINVAKTAGFDQINLDLMYGLPQQQAEQAMDDLTQAISHQPNHLSWYQLTIEPNTVFYKNTPVLPVEDEIWNIQEQGMNMIASSGYENYEISAYAMPGYQCKHNLNYWEFGDYIGIGAGAHSKLTNINNNEISRSVRHRLPERYIELAGNKSAVAEHKLLTEQDVILEFMMNNLRLTKGFTTLLFEQRTGIKIHKIQEAIHVAENKGWLEREDMQIKPSSLGKNYLNDLLQCFMSDSESIPVNMTFANA
ncbi:MAG: putative oxygen-independent coproporphyrinogen III oxidase [Gammaproteobacteria bacterium]|jgi:putative oxygen-independent coproporphyrinogen III oxidase